MEKAALPDLGFTWTEAKELLMTTGVDFALNAVEAVLIFYIGKLVVALIVRGVRRVMQAQDVDATLEAFVSNLLRMALLLMVVIAAISALGIQTTSFIAVIGAAGLAIGLALQGSLSNFASGVLIVMAAT